MKKNAFKTMILWARYKKMKLAKGHYKYAISHHIYAKGHYKYAISHHIYAKGHYKKK